MFGYAREAHEGGGDQDNGLGQKSGDIVKEDPELEAKPNEEEEKGPTTEPETEPTET